MPVTIDAKSAIGEDDDATDWQLRPEDHAKRLPPQAGALKRVLQRNAIHGIIERFGAADAAAKAAQLRYKRLGRLALYASTLATLVGALFLLPMEPWLIGAVSGMASLIQILGLVVAFVAARTLALGNPFDRWMKQRAEAEIARVELFDAITNAQEPSQTGELPLLPLQLEYFRRYQLDVQQRYYSGRGAQHAAAVWRNNRWLSASLFFTVASVLFAVLLGLHVAASWGLPVPSALDAWSAKLAGPQAHRVLLALGVIASGLYGLGVTRSLMDLDERNASRYLTTSKNLAYLRETTLSKARDSAMAGEQTEVAHFVERVRDLISSEHKEWTLLSSRDRITDPEKLRRSGPRA